MSRTAPVGILNGTFDELYSAGCMQTGADICEPLERAQREYTPMFEGLMVGTTGNPCDGCPIWENKGDDCPAYSLYHTTSRRAKIAIEEAAMRHKSAISPAGTDKYPGMSVANIAEKLGISKGEVRRRKQRGEL